MEDGNKTVGPQKLIARPVCFPAAMITALDAQAHREGVFSRSEIVRRACSEYLDRAQKKARRTSRTQTQEQTA